MVDTGDLKSPGLWPCQFKSGLRYHMTIREFPAFGQRRRRELFCFRGWRGKAVPLLRRALRGGGRKGVHFHVAWRSRWRNGGAVHGASQACCAIDLPASLQSASDFRASGTNSIALPALRTVARRECPQKCVPRAHESLIRLCSRTLRRESSPLRNPSPWLLSKKLDLERSAGGPSRGRASASVGLMEFSDISF